MSTVEAPTVISRGHKPDQWDVIVIGAGPAGSLAARQLARTGARTLLVDSKHFPREKVCGGYLNNRAIQVLEQTRLYRELLGDSPPEPQTLEVIAGRQRARFTLPPARIVARPEFDERLLHIARAAGATAITGAQATVEPSRSPESRTVTIVRNNSREFHQACVVVCADGLSRTSIRHLPEFDVTAHPVSRVGIGAVVTDDDDSRQHSQITMVVSPRGYIGISRIDAQHLNIAAAVEPALLSHTSPAEVATSMLQAAGVAVPRQLSVAAWRGTPPLTSGARHVASERVFLLGDAAGYVEPFTGEGMAAAFESAVAIVPIVLRAIERWTPDIAQHWQLAHQQLVRDRSQTCRRLAWIVRRPWATMAMLAACRLLPGIASRMIANTTRPAPINPITMAARL